MTAREAAEHLTEAVPRERWLARYRAVRRQTELLCVPLATEDYVVQTLPCVSPPKWHLAHVSWFFERFVLADAPGYEPYHPLYAELFNSYYHSLGTPFPRHERGLLSRPTVEEVYRYRAHVDAAMLALIDGADAAQWQRLHGRIELGLQHEQQHQELLLTDIKHIFACNPLRPIYSGQVRAASAGARTPGWLAFHGGVLRIGHPGVSEPDGAAFHFDNETPRHETLLRDYALGNRLVSNEEYLAFIGDGGYERPELWLADGWTACRREGWQAPLYWERLGGDWWMMTLAGMRPVAAEEPVCHVSYYEADAYARWAGARLPTEAELELALARCAPEGHFAESGLFHPQPAEAGRAQLYGDAWEWTQSAYLPYPGYRPPAGALGEYNGKFMCNQMVLKGGSCATPRAHIRASYRNFFAPADRWQFSGIRLARA